MFDRVALTSSTLAGQSIAFPVNELVDAVFVLSVRSFHGRIAHIEAELGRHGIAFEWNFDYDAATGLLGLVAFAWSCFPPLGSTYVGRLK